MDSLSALRRMTQMVVVGPDSAPAGGMMPSAKLMFLSAQRVNGSWGSRAAQSPGVVSVRVCGRDPLAAPERRRVESWAVGYGRLRDRPTPLMIAASSASEKGPDGDSVAVAVAAGWELLAGGAGAGLLGGLLAGGVPAGENPANASRTAARAPARPPLLLAAATLLRVARPHEAIAGLPSTIAGRLPRRTSGPEDPASRRAAKDGSAADGRERDHFQPVVRPGNHQDMLGRDAFQSCRHQPYGLLCPRSKDGRRRNSRAAV